MSLTLDELRQIRESLRELVADPQIDFGPAYEGAKQRQIAALKLLNKGIRYLTPPVDVDKIIASHADALAKEIDKEVLNSLLKR